MVVEAAPKSGSLISAGLALDYGRELFAVPGSPLDPRSRGSNDLLRQRHAHLVENADDVLRELPELPAGAGADRASPSPPSGWGRGRAGGLAAAGQRARGAAAAAEPRPHAG